MQPDYLSLLPVFGTTRHIVPLFQRPYVWEREKNWEPLWQDIEDLCNRLLENQDGKVRGHFLGTLVLQQIPHKLGAVSTREVIDGQQRLTTLQILFQASRHALHEASNAATAAGDETGAKAAQLAASRIGKMIENTDFADEQEKYKVWPTNEDRAPFRQVIDAQEPADLAGVTTQMANAYHYFLGELRAWLGVGPAANRATVLAAALQEHVRLIVLDLDKTDEPQAIFETLNAHGTPLLPADLIKNWLLWEASRQGLQIETLYKQFWAPFDVDHAFWRTVSGTGHAARARIDTFLQNWLTMRAREQIAAKHLYDRFTKRMATEASAIGETTKTDVADVMKDIKANAERFRELNAPTGKTRFDTFLRRLQTLDLGVLHPFLLAVMGREASGQADRDQIGRILESYLVRRMVGGYNTRGYNALAISLLGALHEAGPTNPAAPAVLAVLSKEDGKAIKWPSDVDFEREWLRRQFYGTIRRDRVVMLLQAIEEHYQQETSKSDPIVHFDYSKLELEHVMPQKWRDNWPVLTEDAARQRDGKINTIGNLTLVSGPLNASLSNAAWVDTPGKKGKRSALDEHTILRLNAHLVKKHEKAWDESTIDARALALFQVVRVIWPEPLMFGAGRHGDRRA